jgi:hypothetical protein
MNPNSNTDLYSQGGDWLMGTVRRNPEGLLLLAAGCALLMRSRRGNGGGNTAKNIYRDLEREVAKASDKASGSVSGMREGLASTAESATDYAADLKDRASGVVSSYAESISDFAGDARRAVSEGSERFTRQAQSTMQMTMDRVLRDQPLAVAMVGLAAGAAVAAAFPATEVENRVLGSTHDALSNAVDQAGKSVMGAAAKATERLKEAVEERGLTSDALKDLAGEVASSFTDAVTGKSENKADSKGTMTGAGASSGASSSGGGAKTSNSANASSKPAPSSWPNAGGTR